MLHNLSKTYTLVFRYLSIILIFGLLFATYPLPHSYAQELEEELVLASETPLETSASTSPQELVIIDTGAADALDDIHTLLNTNTIDTASASPQATSTTGATSSPSTSEKTSSSTTTTTPEAGTLIEIANDATSTTTATTTANTGGNTATTSNSGTAIVVTGNASAYTNVVNLTNTNIINSTGFIAFLTQFFGQGNIDFRDMFNVFSSPQESTISCTVDNCLTPQPETYTSNQTAINNNITVSASTGNNTASGSTAAVLSGNAYAAANVTNIANTNIIDANYLVLTFGNFGDMIGDFIFPGQKLLQKLFKSAPSAQMESTVTTNNQANIENSVNTTANTGNNSSTGSSSAVLTGNATTYNNVYNQVNTNAVNNDSFSLMFRIHGNWNGSIFGLPEGFTLQHTDTGISISNAVSQTTPATVNSSATINNSADITNNISVTADTGNNQTTGSDISYIETGNAYAAANVTNVANTNILGRNWSLLIFDIFGDWNGNVSFGQPDVWIGGTANAIDGTTAAGAEVQYTFTISNLGDAMATNVLLNGSLNSALLTLDTPIENIEIGNIAPGETVEKVFTAQVTSSLPVGSFPVDLTAEISSSETDANLENNSEIVTVIAENNSVIRYSGGGGSSNNSKSSAEGNIIIEKTADTHFITPGETVSYTVSLTNSGGTIYNGILYDTLYDSSGEVMLDQNWPLQTISSGETITITYEVAFATSTTLGSYFNRAQVLGYHKNNNPKYAKPYDSMIATVPLTVGEYEAVPAVLGIATSSPECGPYLNSFLKSNQTNNQTDLEKLHTFLTTNQSLAAPFPGYFDSSIETAVKAFQLQHRESILDPWGLDEPTGYVYYTTQKTINEIYCENTKSFPLTAAQVAEIQRHKNLPILASRPNTPQKTPIKIPTTATSTPEPITAKVEPTILPPALDFSTLTTSAILSSPSRTLSSNRFTKMIQWVEHNTRKIGVLKFW